jgi:hypothetical protein
MIRKEEIAHAKHERVIVVVVLVFAAAIAMIAALLMWKGQITGFQVLDESGTFCVAYGELGFISEEEVVLSGVDGYQLKLSCIPGNITLLYDSEFINISSTGLVRLTEEKEAPEMIKAIIIAEHESGEIIHKKFRFQPK